MCLSKGTAAFEFVSGLMYVKHHSLFIAIHEMMRLNDFWKTPSKMWNLPLRGRSDCRPTAPGCGCPFGSHFPVGHTEEKFGSFLSSCLSPTWKSADFVLRTSTYGLFWRRSVAVLKSFFFPRSILECGWCGRVHRLKGKRELQSRARTADATCSRQVTGWDWVQLQKVGPRFINSSCCSHRRWRNNVAFSLLHHGIIMDCIMKGQRP